MKLSDIKIGDYVAYIPKHLLMGPKEHMVQDDNVGIVVSKNDICVFVVYPLMGQSSMGTSADDLYTLEYRPDLIGKMYEAKKKKDCPK